MTDRPEPPPGLRVWHPAWLIATWLGAGLFPKAPGTWGSLTALPFAWMIAWAFGPIGLLAAATALFPLGWWAGGVYSKRSGEKDPGPVVVDEVAGQWLTLAAIPASEGLPDPVAFAIGFALFRVADITKPWPANWADRRLEGGLGIMLDDVVAAVYAGAILYILTRWVGL